MLDNLTVALKGNCSRRHNGTVEFGDSRPASQHTEGQENDHISCDQNRSSTRFLCRAHEGYTLLSLEMLDTWKGAMQEQFSYSPSLFFSELFNDTTEDEPDAPAATLLLSSDAACFCC